MFNKTFVIVIVIVIVINSKQVFIDILYTGWIRLAPHATHTHTHTPTRPPPPPPHTHTPSYYLHYMNISIYQLGKPLLK